MTDWVIAGNPKYYRIDDAVKKDAEVKKYQKYARGNNTEMFVDSLFPNKFKDIVTQCYLNNNESFE